METGIVILPQTAKLFNGSTTCDLFNLMHPNNYLLQPSNCCSNKPAVPGRQQKQKVYRTLAGPLAAILTSNPHLYNVSQEFSHDPCIRFSYTQGRNKEVLRLMAKSFIDF